MREQVGAMRIGTGAAGPLEGHLPALAAEESRRCGRVVERADFRAVLGVS